MLWPFWNLHKIFYITNIFQIIFGFIVFILAFHTLHNELAGYHYHDIVKEIQAIGYEQIALALGLTLIGYLLFSGYDFLATHYVKKPISFFKCLFIAFISYSIGNSTGFANLATSSLRFRMYSDEDYTPLDITQLIIFCGITFWLGFIALSSFFFLVDPLPIPPSLHLPFKSLLPLGIIFLQLVLLYGVLCALNIRPLEIKGFNFKLPQFRFFLGQLLVSVLDWLIAGTIFYILLPFKSEISYSNFLTIYLFAQAVALLSHVPGGLGVLEAILVLFLSSPTLKASEILSCVLIYRAIYYLIPFSIAACILAISEIHSHHHALKKVSVWMDHKAGIIGPLVPSIIALGTFASGLLLLFSSVTPSVKWRLEFLSQNLPLPFLEVSHFLSALVGMTLLFLAWALQRRIDKAYHLTLSFLSVGILFSLLKGFDYEEAFILLGLILFLLPFKAQFYRKAQTFKKSFSLSWIIAIFSSLGSMIWLGFFSFHHAIYSQDLWLSFTLHGDAARFLRVLFGLSSFVIVALLYRWLSPASPDSAPTELTPELYQKIKTIIGSSTSTNASLVLLKDKKILLSQNEKAFLMYGIEGRSFVTLGNPVGPREEWDELIWQFRELCDVYDARPVFYQIGKEAIDIYIDLGLSFFKIGEEAVVSLESFSLDGGKFKKFRHHYNVAKETLQFSISQPPHSNELIQTMTQISNSWLENKNTKEKKFSLGNFSAEYINEFPCAFVLKDNEILAFANILTTSNKEELSLDLMRFDTRKDLPNFMDYLFLELIFWGKTQGYKNFYLGVSPLAGLQRHPLASTWNKIGSLLFKHGEYFYNFEGLRNYKEKFKPRWESVYIAGPGGLSLPLVLKDIAKLTSGGIKGIIKK